MKKPKKPLKLENPDWMLVIPMCTYIETILKDRQEAARKHLVHRSQIKVEVQELRKLVMKQISVLRGGFHLHTTNAEKHAYFDIAVADLKKEGKLIAVPMWSRPGSRRFDKKTRRFSSEPWIVGYEYEWCDSILDTLALAAQ